MQISKEALFLVSWTVGTVSLVAASIHCFTTRNTPQPWLLASKLTLAASIALALPYAWSLRLQRYRLLCNVAIYVMCAGVLFSGLL